MVMARDYLGFDYDASRPAFILMPPPIHPKLNDGSAKFILHRRTQRMLDRAAVLAEAAKDGYVFPPYEMGKDNEFLRGIGFSIPYEFTITADPTKWWSDDVSFTLTGPATATERVRVNYTPAMVDTTEVPFVAFSARNTGFWIEVGDTFQTVRGKLNAMDMSDVGYNGAPYTPTADKQRRVLQIAATTGNVSPAPLRIFSQIWGGWAFDSRFEHRMPLNFGITGINMVWGGVAPIPAVDIRAELADDKLSAVVFVAGTTPTRSSGGTIVEMHSISVNGGIIVAGSVESKMIRTTVAQGLGSKAIADALRTWLNGYVPPVNGVVGTNVLTAEPITSPVACFRLIAKNSSGAVLRFDFAPYFNCY